jgi:hypothetical protein
MAKYQVICTNPDVYAIQAYGQAESPLFATEAEADAFLAKCVESWPEGSDVRDDYDIVVTDDNTGYSSATCGWLVVGGVQHELSQVGPDFCILRQPIPGDFVVTDDIHAKLIIDVDGNRREVPVLLQSVGDSQSEKIGVVGFLRSPVSTGTAVME